MWEHSPARMRASTTTAMGRPPVLAITAMGSLCAPSARLGTFVRAPATQSGTETNNVDANYPGNVDANYPGSAEAAGPPGRMQAAQQRGCERPSGADAGEHHHRDERAFVCPFGAVGHVRTGTRDPSGHTRPVRACATRAGTRAPSGHSPAPADASRPQAFGGQGPSPPGPPSVLPSPPCERYFSNSCAIASPLASGESTVSRACSSCSM